MLLFFVINFGRFLSFVAHVQVLIADNFGIFTLFQALIEDNFVIFNPLRKNKHHPGLEPVWRIQNVLMRIRIHSTFFSKREKKLFFFQIFIVFFYINLHNLSCVIFSVAMREEGLGVRDKV